MHNSKPPSSTTVNIAGHAPPMRPLRVDSTTLMSGQRVLEIVHQGEVYRLQTTRLGKLILTK